MITVADVQDHARNNPFAKTCEVTDAEGKKGKMWVLAQTWKEPGTEKFGGRVVIEVEFFDDEDMIGMDMRTPSLFDSEEEARSSTGATAQSIVTNGQNFLDSLARTGAIPAKAVEVPKPCNCEACVARRESMN